MAFTNGLTYDIREGSATLGLDGEAAIKALQRDSIAASDADYDILWSIRDILDKTPFKYPLNG